MSVLLLELHRAEIAEGGMSLLAIVPNLNVLSGAMGGQPSTSYLLAEGL